MIFKKYALFSGLAVLALSAGIAPSRAATVEVDCHAALRSLMNDWNAAGLPMPPVGPSGTKATAIVSGKDGYTTSLANLEYMATEFRAAQAACQPSDAPDTAMQLIANVRSRLPVTASDR